MIARALFLAGALAERLLLEDRGGDDGLASELEQQCRLIGVILAATLKARRTAFTWPQLGRRTSHVPSAFEG